MVRVLTVFFVLLAWAVTARGEPVAASSQAAPSGEMLDQFARSFATPTRMTGKIARWESPVCPLTVGQPPKYTDFVSKRIKDVAAMVGAPVSEAPDCKPNIEIVFTTTPQALLDGVRAHQTDFLGYAQTGAERERLATITRPVQAWYLTQTRDLRGITRIDTSRHLNSGATMACFTCLPCPFCKGQNSPPLDLPEASAAVTGSSIRDGARSYFYHAIIVVDVNRLAGFSIGPLSDYIALLALAQLNSLDNCQQLPSIVNMLGRGCEQNATEITPNDLAYLRGLYRMNPESKLMFQQSDIASQMKETLGR